MSSALGECGDSGVSRLASPARPAAARAVSAERRAGDGHVSATAPKRGHSIQRGGLGSDRDRWQNWPASQVEEERWNAALRSARGLQRSRGRFLERDHGRGAAADGAGRPRAGGEADRPVAAGGRGDAARRPDLAPRVEGLGDWTVSGAGNGGAGTGAGEQRRRRRGLRDRDRRRRPDQPRRRHEPARPDAAPPAAPARQAAQGAGAAPARLRRRAAQAGRARDRRRPRPDLPLAALRDRPRVDRGAIASGSPSRCSARAGAAG